MSSTGFKYACGCDCPCVSHVAEEHWDYRIHISSCVTDLCPTHEKEIQAFYEKKAEEAFDKDYNLIMNMSK